MLPDLRQFIETVFVAVAALVPIVNPLGGAPIYLTKTVDLTSEQHDELALRVARNCAVLLLASLLLGAYLLDFFGLSVPIVQVAGGLVVCSIAWSLLHDPDAAPPMQAEARRVVSSEDLRRRAFYPLTMPLTVGPGSISVAITLGSQRPRGFATYGDMALVGGAAIAGLLGIALTIYVCYRYADTVVAILGERGTNVMVRLSAFILLCIGIQILWTGWSALSATVGR